MNRNVVSAAGAAFITAQQKVGVAATGKHFPGLGASAASQNTDAGPVTLNLSAATIRGVDEFPYRAAIAAGVKLVMVSWAVYPSLGSKRPAGLTARPRTAPCSRPGPAWISSSARTARPRRALRRCRG